MKLRPDTATRDAAIAAIILIAALTAGCSSSSDATTTTSSTLGSTSVPPSSSAPVTATPNSNGSTSATRPATPTTSTSPPWPADFTPEQQTDAQAAITAYLDALRATDEAYSDPGRSDLDTFIRQYMTDPRADQVVKAAAGMAADGEHSTGQSTATVVATAIDGSRVSLDVCLDSSQKDLIDAKGNSIKANLPVGNRVKQTANVYHYSAAGDRWLLSEVDAPQPYVPC